MTSATAELRDHGSTDARSAGRQAAAHAEAVCRELDLDIGSALLAPNVALTLAGERGSADLYPRAASADVADLVAVTNRVLEDVGIRVFVTGAADAAYDWWTLDVGNLHGYRCVSERTRLPGVEPFDAEEGWEGLLPWFKRCRAGVCAAQARGQLSAAIGAEHYLIGLILGYPDRAISGYLPVCDASEPEGLYTFSEIPLTDRYPGAEPNYGYLIADRAHPQVVGHQRRWAIVLEAFYGSDWHRTLAGDPEFRAARERIDRSVSR